MKEKHTLLHYYPWQIPLELCWAGTQASVVRSQCQIAKP
jgi:hypothetical protein